jgi:hypothetical protein
MRYLPLLLVLALAACDTAVEAPPSSGPTVRYLMWGPSNAGILGSRGTEPLNRTFSAATGRTAVVEPTATWGGRGLMPETDEGAKCGDFSPHSEDECYDQAVELTREALAQNSASSVVGGVIWHNGVDQRAIGEDSLFTQEDYDAEFRDLIRAFARDFPGVPFYLIEAGTDYTVETTNPDAPAFTAQFREHEAAVCESEFPNCRLISAMTTEVLEETADVCGTDVMCVHANYFEQAWIHWQSRSVEIIMEEAGRALAQLETGG